MSIRKILLAALCLGPLATSAQAQTAPSLYAVLNGGNECNGAVPPLCRQGDPDGYGSATITIVSATSICFGLTVNNLAAPTAAHIHTGATGVNGGVVVGLAPPVAPGGGTPGASSGCVAGLGAGLVNQIRTNPQNFYVNVHNGPFPGGAVRGQLF
jgi:CHRD domain